jgi:ATP-binding cassette, subfamily B, heavy metal transporter
MRHRALIAIICSLAAPVRAFGLVTRVVRAHDVLAATRGRRPSCRRLQLCAAPSIHGSSMAAVPALDELAGTREFGARELLSYLWPASGATRSKLRVVGALALLLAAKLFIVRVPFIFKRCIDSLSSPAASPLAPVGWMLVYSFSRAIYTLLQEGRYLMFTPVGQSALRRFIRDAFEHVQQLDAGWLGSQSTGELSRIFARGVRGMNTLLRLLVFNVLPTTLEAALVVTLLGRRYGTAVALASLLCVLVFTSWSILMVGRRVALLSEMNDIDNAIFTRFFNSLLNNEAVRSFTNERHEVIQYERLLQRVEGLSIRDVQTVSLLNAGQALVFSTGLAAVMACCARRVMCGAMGLGDAVAIHGMLLQLHGPLTSLGFTYQDIRGALTDMRQLVTLLRRTPAITSPLDAPELTVSHGAIRFEDVSFAYGGKTSGALRNVTFAIEPGQKTAIVGPSGNTFLGLNPGRSR